MIDVIVSIIIDVIITTISGRIRWVVMRGRGNWRKRTEAHCLPAQKREL